MMVRPARRPSRRDFLRTALAWPLLPSLFGGDPYRLLTRDRAGIATRPVRVRGRVHANGRGLHRVAVTDGLRVTATDRSGAYELVTDTARRYVTVSVPAGHGLPTSASGTVRSYHRLGPEAPAELRADFPLQRLPAGDDRHAFLLLADIQAQDRTDMTRFERESLPDLQATVAGLHDVPLFGVADGDILWDDLTLYDDYERIIAALGIPFVQVVGNHDLDLRAGSDLGATATFERRFGPRYYSFDRGQIHYVVLDDVFYHGGGYLGYVDDDQLTWLANDLALVEPGRPVVVFAHIPLYSTLPARRGAGEPSVSLAVTNRDAVYRLLEPYRALILTGHIHESDLIVRGGVVERNHGTVCGAWWTGNICYDGTPNGYGVYEVTGSEIRWRYKATGQDRDHQLRVYPRGADPGAPDELVANVWSWEPGWSVVWYEGGDRRGAMARRVGLDPLAVEQQTGPDLPAKRSWVDPVPTSHLFYAPVSSQARNIRIEATDPWGRAYSVALAG